MPSLVPVHLRITAGLLLFFAVLLLIGGVVSFLCVIDEVYWCLKAGRYELTWQRVIFLAAVVCCWPVGILFGYTGDYLQGNSRGIDREAWLNIVILEMVRSLLVILAAMGIVLAVMTAGSEVEENFILALIIGAGLFSLLTWIMGKSVASLQRG